MVMVPTLTPADDTAPPPASAGSFRPQYMPPAFPPIPVPQQEHSQGMYGGGQSRHPPPPGAWGGFPGANPYGGSAQMDLHDARPHR